MKTDNQEQSNQIKDLVFKELQGESERACAIVGAAFLDDLLESILAKYLLSSNRGFNELLSSDQFTPLGSFGARITFVYWVELIPENIMQSLRKIKKIRNQFAHNIELTFEDQEISKHCLQLRDFLPDLYFTDENPSPRELFISSTAYLAGALAQCLDMLTVLELSGNFTSVQKLFKKTLENQ